MIFIPKKRFNFQIFVFSLSVFFPICKGDNTTDSIQNDMTFYISGGTILDKHDLAKYIVSIQLNLGIRKKFGWCHICGGSIIGKKKILTAAHCLQKSTEKHRLFKPNEIEVVVGLRNRFTQTYTSRVKRVAYLGIHRKFNQLHRLTADVGYVILKKEILFDNPQTAIIELADREPKANQLCTIIGWGRLFYKGPTSDELEFADVKIYRNRACRRIFDRSFTTGMLCAADPRNFEIDACTGDSGGPLICERKLVGIISWGIECGTFPGVYTDVYYYKKWIEANNGHSLLLVNYLVLIVLIKFVT